jgi:hypothetical protein
MNAALRPMFLGDWQRALFIHYETDPVMLQWMPAMLCHRWFGLIGCQALHERCQCAF